MLQHGLTLAGSHCSGGIAYVLNDVGTLKVSQSDEIGDPGDVRQGDVEEGGAEADDLGSGVSADWVRDVIRSMECSGMLAEPLQR